jgi:hypothetical protein
LNLLRSSYGIFLEVVDSLVSLLPELRILILDRLVSRLSCPSGRRNNCPQAPQIIGELLVILVEGWSSEFSCSVRSAARFRLTPHLLSKIYPLCLQTETIENSSKKAFEWGWTCLFWKYLTSNNREIGFFVLISICRDNCGTQNTPLGRQ